jgi:hypothetical protein
VSDAPTSQRRSPSVFLSPRQTSVHVLINHPLRCNHRPLTRAPILLLRPHPPRFLPLLHKSLPHLHHLSLHHLSLHHLSPHPHLLHLRTTMGTPASMALHAKSWLSSLPTSDHNQTTTQTVCSAQSPPVPFLSLESTEFGDCDGPNLNGNIAHVPCSCPPLRDDFINVSW